MHSDQLDQLATSLAAAQAEFTAIPKDSTNPFFKSSYAALPQVVELASPIVAKHGLSVSQFISHDGEADMLTTWLMHKSGQWIKDTMRLHLVKDDPQAQGSATTYARRYSYMAVLGLVADEDDDGNAASSGSSRPPAKKPASKSTEGPTDAQVAKIRALAAMNDISKEDTEARLATITTKQEASEAIKKLEAIKGEAA